MKKRWIAAGLAAVTACSVFISGCGDDKKAAADKIVRVAGTVSVSSSSMDPAKGWDGWYIVRYGVGETLFKVGDGLKIEPWLAEKFERLRLLSAFARTAPVRRGFSVLMTTASPSTV